jgi:hypothetical protein
VAFLLTNISLERYIDGITSKRRRPDGRVPLVDHHRL